MDDNFTLEEAARRLGISEKLGRHYIHEGHLPASTSAAAAMGSSS